jgi:hypothetical protein
LVCNDGHVKQLTDFTNVVGYAYAGVNPFAVTPCVAASVIPMGAYGSF